MIFSNSNEIREEVRTMHFRDDEKELSPKECEESTEGEANEDKTLSNQKISWHMGVNHASLEDEKLR